ncbi:hypothetical protein [Streptomyces sp. NPDC053728]|uniref:hypothetical protein n=1 Tax=Streptomyces sp. NPDC053728 TaxID=3155534 RepID=UPI003435BDA1
MTDPLPQAIALTAIVITLATTAFLLAMPRGAPAGDCESYLDGDHLFRTTTKSASSVSCARTRSGMSTPCSASMATAC